MMTTSSRKKIFFIFGLVYCVFLNCFYSLNADDKKKKKKEKEESKIIFDSGLGEFDWTGKKKSSYQKNIETVRKPSSKEEETKAVCPVCDKEIPTIIITATRNGLDYDFCEHFVGNSPYIFDLWSCSVCGYTSYRKTFSQPLGDEDKVFVKKYLTEPMHKEIKAEFGTLLKDIGPKPLKQVIIPSIAKIKNFAAFIEHRNDLDDKWKAFYFVRAVYALRNLIATAPSCASLNKAFLEISKRVEGDTKIPENEKQMPHVSAYYLSFYLFTLSSKDYKEISKERLSLHLLIAQCFNRLGYYTESKNNINKAAEICKKLQDVDDAAKIIKDLGDLIELEKSYSLKAITYMKDALEQKLDYGNNQNAIIYLIGELSRRCEVFADAYLFLAAAKMLFPKEIPIYSWVEEHLKRKELINDDFLILTPPAYLKQIVLEHNKK